MMRAEVEDLDERRGSNPCGASSTAMTSVPGSPPLRHPVVEIRRQKAESSRQKAVSGRRKAEGGRQTLLRCFVLLLTVRCLRPTAFRFLILLSVISSVAIRDSIPLCARAGARQPFRFERAEARPLI